MCCKAFITTLLCSLFCFTTLLNAQESTPKREVGIQFSGLNFSGSNSFSALFKKQKKEQVYRRLRLFYGSLRTQIIEDDYTIAFGSGIAIGREKRKSLDPKLEFYQGPEFSASLAISTVSDINTDVIVRGGFGWVLGLQHSFNERWAVNLETTPGISLNVSTSTARDVTNIGLDASASSNVSLGLVRKF